MRAKVIQFKKSEPSFVKKLFTVKQAVGKKMNMDGGKNIFLHLFIDSVG
ncbi:MAG: hypothetical protein ABI045_04120 [Flavobacteriales bacterium]